MAISNASVKSADQAAQLHRFKHHHPPHHGDDVRRQSHVPQARRGGPHYALHMPASELPYSNNIFGAQPVHSPQAARVQAQPGHGAQPAASARHERGRYVPHAGRKPLYVANVHGLPHTRPELLKEAVARLEVDPAYSSRSNQPIQRFKLNGAYAASLARYPQTEGELQALLREAMQSGKLTNLKSRRDGGLGSYADAWSARGTAVGDLIVKKVPLESHELGRNFENEPVTFEKYALQIFDRKDRAKGWQTVVYKEIGNWTDREALPAATFERVSELLKTRSGSLGEVHCYGGIGRTGCAIVDALCKKHLRHENSRGRYVTDHQMAVYAMRMINRLRELRGNDMLPDSPQVRMVLESVFLAVDRQRVGVSGTAVMNAQRAQLMRELARGR